MAFVLHLCNVLVTLNGFNTQKNNLFFIPTRMSDRRLLVTNFQNLKLLLAAVRATDTLRQIHKLKSLLFIRQHKHQRIRLVW